jgi:hypothetical protein
VQSQIPVSPHENVEESDGISVQPASIDTRNSKLVSYILMLLLRLAYLVPRIIKHSKSC